MNFFFIIDLEPIKNILDVNVAQTSKLSKEIAAIKEMLIKQAEKSDQIAILNQKILNQLGGLDKANAGVITTEDKVFWYMYAVLHNIFFPFLFAKKLNIW